MANYYYNLTQTQGADMETRFHVNGKRVSRATFDAIRNQAARLGCFSTRARQLPGGKTRRTNYSVAVLAHPVQL